MKEDRLISNKEQFMLFAAVLIGLIVRMIELASSLFFSQHNPKTEFGLYDIFDMAEMMSPLYSFLAFFVCALLIWKINFTTLICSSVLILLLTIFFDWWFIDTRQIIAYAAKVNPEYHFKTFDFILVSGSIYDVITLFLTNFILFWQISILLRMLIKTSQKQNVLP